MRVIHTAIPDLLIIEPRVFGDDRGFFFESFNRRRFAELTGRDVDFVQDNHSRSAQNVLRGLHYQIQYPQGKLVRVVQGAVLDGSGGHPQELAHFRQACRCGVVGREQTHAVDTGRLCARLQRADRDRGFSVQNHRLLVPGTRALHTLG